MKNINKIVVCLAMLGFLILNFTLANNTDCGIFARMTYKQDNGQNGFKNVENNWETESTGYSNFLTIEQQTKIITKNDLNTAMLNLKKYCCENKLGGVDEKTCDVDKVFFNPNALDSQYLFDHIFDVIMRRLAGLTGDTNIYTKTNMTGVDDKGGKRRSYISRVAEDLEGSDVQSIVDTYQEYWQKSSPNLGYDIVNEINGTFALGDQEFLEYVIGNSNNPNTEESKKVSEALKNYDKWTLYDRYSNACALTKYFYALLSLGNSENSDRGVVVDRLGNGACEDFVQAQIENENIYVQAVAQNSANLFLENYVKGYMQYLYGRGNSVKSLWKSVEDRRLDVIRAVPNLVKTCVK